MITQITDHTDQAQERMVKRFKDKERIDKIIKIRVDRIQLLENILIRLLGERALSTAVGVQLDGIGELYGESGDRNNRTDEEYRAFLKVLPAKLRDAGQHEVLIQAYANLTNAIRIEHEYFYPRALALHAVLADVDSLTNESDINSQMQAIRAQGVRLDLGTIQESENFLFSSSTNGDVPMNSGFSSLADGSDGGKFYKLITDGYS